MNPPKVFISTTSGDLRSVRQIVKEALLTINCHPVEQTNFEPDARTLEKLDRQKLEDCQALIHLVGFRYGAEPRPDTLLPGTPRRSYTQMEYHEGRRHQAERGDDHFRVYVFLCPEDFPFDPEPDTESDEMRALQQDHRQLILNGLHRYETPRTKEELHARILAVQEQVLALKQKQTEVKCQVQRSHKTLILALILLLVLIGGLAGVYHMTQRGLTEIKARQVIDIAKIKAHLRESSERKRDEDSATADKEPKSDDRQHLRDVAEAAHQSRLSRIDEFAASFALLEGKAGVTDELKELTRILQEEGAEKALEYAGRQKPTILKAVASSDGAHLEQKRARLQPLLHAAGLQWTEGRSASARASYQELVELDPIWPNALEMYARFLGDQASHFEMMGMLSSALSNGQECLVQATRLCEAVNDSSDAQQLLLYAHHQMSIILRQRGAESDREAAFQHCSLSLTLAENLLRKEPSSSQAARNVSLGLVQMGDLLTERGLPDDNDAAFENYKRSLELLEMCLQVNPKSVKAARDVSVGLIKLGQLLAMRGLPGDVEAALKHYTRSLELRERLLEADRNSISAVRDVSANLDELGYFLAMRGQHADVDVAVAHFTRSLTLRETLLQTIPDSPLDMRDVSITLGRLGDVLSKRGKSGDSDAAFTHHTRSLEFAERLLQASPDSARAMRVLSISLNEMGDFLAQRSQPGDVEAALNYCTRSLQLAEKILQASPDSAQATRDVSLRLDNLGDLLIQRFQPGDASAAFNHYTRSLALDEKLLQTNDNSALASRDVWVSCVKLAQMAETTGQGDALAWWWRAYATLKSMKEKGMYLSPSDLRTLEVVEAKAR